MGNDELQTCSNSRASRVTVFRVVPNPGLRGQKLLSIIPHGRVFENLNFHDFMWSCILITLGIRRRDGHTSAISLSRRRVLALGCFADGEGARSSRAETEPACQGCD